MTMRWKPAAILIISGLSFGSQLHKRQVNSICQRILMPAASLMTWTAVAEGEISPETIRLHNTSEVACMLNWVS
jgi:hypothetical protein